MKLFVVDNYTVFLYDGNSQYQGMEKSRLKWIMSNYGMSSLKWNKLFLMSCIFHSHIKKENFMK